MRSALTFVFTIAVLGLSCTPSAQAEFMELVHVGNVGNAPDTTGYGAVRYPYRIGKFEVTNSQYADFLNSVATKSDPNGLYFSPMETSLNGGIIRIDQGARYSYVVKDGFGSKPVDWVSFYDSVRFVNWLHNDRPVGEQSTSTTEDGAYTITPESVDNYTLVRNHNARFFIPNENEWYKAAYYNALTDDGSYWLYPTQSNDRPSLILPPGPPNSVNHGLDDRVVTEVGAYDTSPGPYGTFDQGGNVWEWIETAEDRDRILRGGSYLAEPDDALRSDDISLLLPSFAFSHIGFRVAAIVPEPNAFATALNFAILGLIMRRRFRAKWLD